INASSGQLSVKRAADEAAVAFTPLADGKPFLAGCRLLEWHASEDVVAALIQDRRVDTPNLFVFQYQEGVPLGQFSVSRPASFVLSPDGRWLARQSAPNQVIVHEITRSPAPVLVTAKGRCHQDLYVEHGHQKIVVQIGNWLHLIRWDRGPLELAH